MQMVKTLSLRLRVYQQGRRLKSDTLSKKNFGKGHSGYSVSSGLGFKLQASERF